MDERIVSLHTLSLSKACIAHLIDPHAGEKYHSGDIVVGR